MSVNDITFGEAKRLAAALASIMGQGTTCEPHPLDQMVGRNVVVRDHRAGIYWGRVQSVGWQPAGGTWIILAPGARQGHYWHREGAVLGLCQVGPVATGQTRYTAPSASSAYMADVVLVAPTTSTADAAWTSMPVWGQ